MASRPCGARPTRNGPPTETSPSLARRYERRMPVRPSATSSLPDGATPRPVGANGRSRHGARRGPDATRHRRPALRPRVSAIATRPPPDARSGLRAGSGVAPRDARESGSSAVSDSSSATSSVPPARTAARGRAGSGLEASTRSVSPARRTTRPLGSAIATVGPAAAASRSAGLGIRSATTRAGGASAGLGSDRSATASAAAARSKMPAPATEIGVTRRRRAATREPWPRVGDVPVTGVAPLPVEDATPAIGSSRAARRQRGPSAAMRISSSRSAAAAAPLGRSRGSFASSPSTHAANSGSRSGLTDASGGTGSFAWRSISASPCSVS